ncbi:MAG: Gfo/Idh/MocA family oxidoreductase [Caldilineaceae bacterium]
MSNPTIRFAAIGLNHGHIYGQTSILLKAGAELVSVYAEEADLLAEYTGRFPQAKVARSQQEILDDESLQLIISAAIPCDRAPLGIEVMRHGKDYMSDKPGFTALEQLAQVRQAAAETGRIYSIDYSERFENRATVKAGELVYAGAIGDVIQTIGMGPHLRRFHTRPEWFFQEEKYGGILCDIGSHQFDQYLYFTGSIEAEIVASQVANYHHPQYPGLQDFGDVMVRSPGCSGYIRVDWFTPDGLPTWGDTRLTIIGTEGYIEVRKNCDIAGRPGSDHLFLVNGQEVQYIDCANVPLTYGRLLIDDILNRTETAMTQEHCLLASTLALQAQAQAARLGHLR